ncbi:uncharacterized protein [Nicotiana tomentosiformis]|uniref:uncharacterized protein n=1 Tax=Nicotiana tomentosiformis TaxID=4098 RepID=UPI00388CC9DF
MQGMGNQIDMSYNDLCMFPDIRLPAGFKMPKFNLYDEGEDPVAHLKGYFTEMRSIGGKHELLMAYLSESLSRAALECSFHGDSSVMTCTWNSQLGLKDRKEDVKKVVLEKAPKNNTMTSPDIQIDVVNSCAKATVKAIIEDLNGDCFGILVDESEDVSHKEQMALVLRYVNKEGELIERFLGLIHVKGTTAPTLQKTIYSLLLQHSVSSSLIRGQGYDGASNMQGEINGLKTLILKDNPSAYCIHCFAHQLQFTLVVVAKKHHDVNNFFDILANVLNVVGGSYKHREMLRDDQTEKLDELLVLDEVHTGSGLNQELGLQRPEDVSSFCDKNGIVIPKIDEKYALGKSKCKISTVTYSHHLYVEVFCAAIDLQLSELNNRFSEVNTDLLLGMANLNPDDSFANYDKNKSMKLTTYYPNEFTSSKLEDLNCELDNYIDYVREMDNAFSNLKGLGDLSKTLVKTNIHKTWGLVYFLVKLSLILPVATAIVEGAFSSMKFIKNDLRSRIGDDFLNDCLVCYIEDEVFESVSNDAIIDRFQNMTSRRL